MEFRLLGPVDVVDDEGRSLSLGPPGQRALLAALVLSVGSPVSIDKLVDLLWGEQPPSSASTIVHGYVAGLRRAMPDGVVVTRSSAYELIAGRIDTQRFEELLRDGRRLLDEDPERASSTLRDALALWRGPALHGIDYEFAYEAARRLEDLRLDTHEARIEADIARGKHRDVIAELEELVSRRPERDRLRALLMLALYGSGRQAEALRAYEEARRWIADELGADPSPQLTSLHEAILRQEATIFSLDQAPTGLFTFLMTDIESSTPLWERDPDAMRRAHARHNAIVREIAARHRGDQPREQGEGDSAVLVFRWPSDAVACAVDLQRALLSERWPDGVEIKVRMAIHTGEAEQRDGTYLGLAIARCARVRALAHGGQILLTGASADLVGDRLHPGTSLEDVGVFELKGLSRPERVWQLVNPDLPRDFPPLAGQLGRRNLPTPLTSFLGRTRELSEIASLLESERMITLTGPGGSGKTRLAIETARNVANRFPAGTWFVDLAPLSGPDLVAPAVAEAAGIRPESGRSLVDAIATALAGRSSLVVLDNCEHVLDGCAEVVTRVLASADGPRFLATSREALCVPGEISYQLTPLHVPTADDPWDRVATADAVRLFAERASASRAGFVVNETNAQLVAEVCRRLDGMPLALELAAARVATLPLRHIAENLDDRFRLLESVTRAALPRHRSLAAAVEWSYESLSEYERLVFERTSVFSGTFGLDAARDVVAGDGVDREKVPELLGRLVARSLVLLDETPEGVLYRLLETLRQYGAERLRERGTSNVVRTKHAEHFVRIAEEGRPRTFHAGSSEWFDELARQYDDLRAALEWSFHRDGAADIGVRLVAALAFYWEQKAVATEGLRWFGEGIRVTEGQAAPERALFLGMAGSARVVLGEFDEAERLCRTASELSRAIGRHTHPYALEGFSAATWAGGIAAWARGDLDRAHDIYMEAIEELEPYGDDLWHLTLAEILLARVYRDRGDLASAEPLAAAALDHARECGEDLNLGIVLDIAGSIAHRAGDLDRARALATQALEHYRRVGYPEGRASALGLAGRLALEQDDLAAAAAAFEEAVELCRMAHARGGMAAALEGLARTLAASGDLGGAALLLGGAAAIREAIGAPAPAAEWPEQNRDRERLEAALGTKAFADALRRGAAMSVDDLIEAYAERRLVGV